VDDFHSCVVQKSRGQSGERVGKPRTVELVVVVDHTEVWTRRFFGFSSLRQRSL
ncbi:unnamed protein product, partial [Tetraodon nigroviridis]